MKLNFNVVITQVCKDNALSGCQKFPPSPAHLYLVGAAYLAYLLNLHFWKYKFSTLGLVSGIKVPGLAPSGSEVLSVWNFHFLHVSMAVLFSPIIQKHICRF